MKLKPYWIKPGVKEITLISDIDAPLSDTNGGVMDTAWTEKSLEGVCLFSRGEMERGFVKVWFYYSDLKEIFLDEKAREDYIFWIDPAIIAEIEL